MEPSAAGVSHRELTVRYTVLQRWIFFIINIFCFCNKNLKKLYICKDLNKSSPKQAKTLVLSGFRQRAKWSRLTPSRLLGPKGFRECGVRDRRAAWEVSEKWVQLTRPDSAAWHVAFRLSGPHFLIYQ